MMACGTHQLDLLAPHFLNQRDDVRGRRWNARSRLHVADHVEFETVDEVGPGTVVRDDFPAGVRRHHLIPPPLSLAEPSVEIGIALRKVRRIVRTRVSERLLHGFRDTPPVVRAEQVMWIAQRVDVAHGSRDLPLRDFQDARRQ